MAECIMCGKCCRIFYIPLTEKELKSRKYNTEFEYDKIKDEPFSEIEKNGWNILKRDKNRCVYLKGKKCSIHSWKPEACKNFICNKEKREKMGPTRLS